VRYLVAFAFLVCGTLAAASPGRITDSVTGNPIAGATIYIFWYYHPLSIPLPVEGLHPADKLCSGSAVATTDANGYYKVPAAMGLHEAHQFVIAEGYYNDWEGPAPDDKHDFAQLLMPLRWDQSRRQEDNWSKRLTPFGDASIDAKLLILAAALRRQESLCNAHNDDKNLEQFHRAARQFMGAAICEASKSRLAPRTDVFRGAFGTLVDQSQLPRRNRSPVSTTLVDEACVRAGESAESPSQPARN